jgi:hypothetical protein
MKEDAKQKPRRGRPPLPPEQRMVRHLGLKLTQRSSVLLDLCVEIEREQSPLATVSLPSFFTGLLERHAREQGLRTVTDDAGKLQRVLRIVRELDRSGVILEQQVQVWPTGGVTSSTSRPSRTNF